MCAVHWQWGGGGVITGEYRLLKALCEVGSLYVLKQGLVWEVQLNC